MFNVRKSPSVKKNVGIGPQSEVQMFAPGTLQMSDGKEMEQLFR
jgi:hypothetical protein